MNTPALPEKRSRSLEYLIPTEFAYVYEDRPVLAFENPRAYTRLLADMIAEYAPKTLIEHHWIKDLVDTIWEIRRLRRLKKAAFEAEIPDAAVQYMGKDFQELAPEFRLRNDEETLKRLARMASQGNTYSKSELSGILLEADKSVDALHYATYAAGLRTINAIDAKLAKAELRRDELCKRFEERRRMLSAMNKSLTRSRTLEGIADVTPADPPSDD